jgi:perosamine synthetase
MPRTGGKTMKYKSSFPYFDDDNVRQILADIETALKSGALAKGPYTKKLEQRFCEFIGARYAVAVSSGAASLEIPLRYFGIKDREVIVPTNTFVATPNSVVFAGGKPIFADMREDTLCIDLNDVKSRISSKTAGVIVVHVAGLVCPEINELRNLCKDNGLFLIEDCAHAHGAMIHDKMAGTLGDVGCFSFAPTKNMTTGEGGILVSDDERLVIAARSMRNRGLDSEELMVMLGHSWLMSEITAILGVNQLENLGFFVNRRNEIAQYYDEHLKTVTGVSLFKTPPNFKHAYHKYPIKLDTDLDAEKIRGILKEQYGIETGRVYYPPCHLHPYYKTTFGTREGDFPVAEKILKQTLTLPIHIGITHEHVSYITNALSLSIQTLRDQRSQTQK